MRSSRRAAWALRCWRFLAEKRRDGARVHKRYHSPATPCQRLIDDPRTDDATRERLRIMQEGLDPVRLLRDIRSAQQRLVALADMTVPTKVGEKASPELDAFLSSLRTAWKSGGGRPTATDKPKVPRGRRRPDPLVDVIDHGGDKSDFVGSIVIGAFGIPIC